MHHIVPNILLIPQDRDRSWWYVGGHLIPKTVRRS